MLTIYGIRNCDTMKKAMAWLDQHGVEYSLHDYKKSGINADTLAAWAQQLGWEALLNRRGTTWRKLDAATQDGITCDTALALMQAQPSLIKRPVVDTGTNLLCGFDPVAWQEQFGS